MTYTSDKRNLFLIFFFLIFSASTFASVGGGVITVTAPTTTVAPGSTFQVSIAANDTTGQGATGFEARIQFDPAVIQPTGSNFGCSTLGTLFSGASVTCNIFPTPNVLSIFVFSLTPITGAGPIVNTNFQAVGTLGSSSPLIFNSFIFNEGDPPSSTVNGLIRLNVSTAAAVSVSGIVLDAKGRSISGAVVGIRDKAGVVKAARTNTFGRFRVDGLTAGRTYFVITTDKRHRFETQVLAVNDNITGLTITPIE